jgi:hypothetical protein
MRFTMFNHDLSLARKSSKFGHKKNIFKSSPNSHRIRKMKKEEKEEELGFCIGALRN